MPEPRFTPAVKNDSGHDENISRAQLANLIGSELAAELERASLALFGFAAGHCQRAGMILVDTKFEFGFIDGRLTLIDEALTPDSSRFWEASQWREGRSMPSFDKQPVRDWLASQPWDRTAPGPDAAAGRCGARPAIATPKPPGASAGWTGNVRRLRGLSPTVRTSPTSPTSACTRCSIADRSRPGSG